MKHYRIKDQLAKGMLVLLAGWGMTACTDDAYDLSKDIDMTMQLGTEGLQLKLGETERIFLHDILEIEDEPMIGEDHNQMFYLIKDGYTNFNFNIPGITTWMDIACMVANQKVFDFADYATDHQQPGMSSLVLPANQVFATRGGIKGADQMVFYQENIAKDVVSVKSIVPEHQTSQFELQLSVQTSDDSRMDFNLYEVKNMRIHLPYFVKCAKLGNGIRLEEATNTLIVSDRSQINQKNLVLGSFVLDRVETKGELGLPVEEKEGKRSLSITDEVSFDGEFAIQTGSSFTVKQGDYAQMKLEMILEGQQVGGRVAFDIDRVTGVFNPEIDPKVDPLNIKDELPDFLNDEAVVIKVANPTIRFDINLRDVPANIQFYGDLTSRKNGKILAQVRIPGESQTYSALDKMLHNTLYFSKQATPYDPNGVVENSKRHTVANLDELVTKIPDEIRVDLSKGHITLKQDELQTIELNRNYGAKTDYTVYVPFQFNKGLKIVYKDSTNSFKDDLEDYQAKGAVVTAKVFSTIPLDLIATAVALDKYGQEIPTVKISEATIPAAGENSNEPAESELQLDMTLAEPADLSKVDRIIFRIEAGANTGSGTLNSKQYLDVKDIRIKLKGAIIVDLN